jgi:hypothetical protein
MTKTDFLWCLSHTKGKVRLWLRVDGDGWTSCFHITLLCTATTQAPQVSKGGEPIGSFLANTFVIAGFQGGTLIESERNDRCHDRAQKALKRYSQWAREAIADRFAEVLAEKPTP